MKKIETEIENGDRERLVGRSLSQISIFGAIAVSS